MPAGGFKTFVAGEILTAADTNDYLMQGILVFAGTAARGSAITSPVEGQFAYLSDSNTLTYHTGSAWEEFSTGPEKFDYLVIGGGGGAGFDRGGGGGAGGYRCSVSGEVSGGGLTYAENPLFIAPGTSVTVTVGAGGAGSNTVNGSQGANSVFGTVTATGGGYGGGGGGNVATDTGGAGGSGGGRGYDGGVAPTDADRVVGQGFRGGNSSATGQTGGGGGGAAEIGSTDGVGFGGDGIASSITGSSVTRAGGGGGAGNTNADGGLGGGGTGSLTTWTSGTANTGGGGGANGTSGTSGAGGSGVVILKYPDSITLTIGAGLTSSTTTSGGFKITSFTAGTDVISF
jgi:hypothetical protein